MKVKGFKENSIEELKIELSELLREQFNLRVQFSSKKLQKVHLLKESRKKIARVKTFLHGKIRGKL
ncbi:50S ribosomal protein L29 [Buchnera aphidicola (Mindarus keteleerifoliae)]|uniref:50S ribosomal protein L29 n=1 Tax=Buchnera aphidicola TaxID=9 RepID=UPI0031B71F1D